MSLLSAVGNKVPLAEAPSRETSFPLKKARQAKGPEHQAKGPEHQVQNQALQKITMAQ